MQGSPFGATRPVAGEVVFNTAMAGYVETLTDPSYRGQILMLTYPIVGNYGIIPETSESDQIWPWGLVVREWAFAPSPPRHASANALPVRRDYVRELAAARGIAVARISTRDAVLPAQPLPAEAPDALVEAEAVGVAAAATVTPPRVKEPPLRIELEATPALATSAVSPAATSELTTVEPRAAAALSEARETEAAREPARRPLPGEGRRALPSRAPG